MYEPYHLLPEQRKNLSIPLYKLGDIVIVAHEGLVEQAKIVRAESGTELDSHWFYSIEFSDGKTLLTREDIVGDNFSWEIIQKL